MVNFFQFMISVFNCKCVTAEKLRGLRIKISIMMCRFYVQWLWCVATTQGAFIIIIDFIVQIMPPVRSASDVNHFPSWLVCLFAGGGLAVGTVLLIGE